VHLPPAVEEGPNTRAVLLETDALGACPYHALTKLPKQQGLQVRSMHGDRLGPDLLVKLRHGYRRKNLTLPRTDLGSTHRLSELPQRRADQAQLVQGPGRVRHQREPRADLLQLSGALEDLRLYPGLPQRDSRRKPADPRPDHDRLHAEHLPIL
jgi:hypothetical protein